MIKLLICLFIITALTACDISSQKDMDTRDVIYDQNKTNNLLKKSLKNGDCKSFQDVVVNKHLADDGYSIFYYSQIMANKYNCPIAYYFLAVDLDTDKGTFIGGITVWSDDEITRNMAIYNYLKAYELGYEPAKYSLEKFFGDNPDNFPKSTDVIVFLQPKLKSENS